jgi:hypothetical protein
MKKSIVLALSTLAGCGSSPPTPDRPVEAINSPAAVAPAATDDVRLLTAYPQTAYDDLGTVQYTFFRPGFMTPALNTIMPELKDKIRQAGGNAFVIVDQSTDKTDKRVLHISAQVLKVK